MRRIEGFTLLELLVASFLGALLIGLIIKTYVNFYNYWVWENAVCSVEDRARFLMHVLSQEIFLAGDASCVNDMQVNQRQAIFGSHVRASDVLVIGLCQFYRGRWQFIRTRYFLADTQRYDAQGNRIVSLYRQRISGRREELIANVSDFSVRYGVMLRKKDHVSLSYKVVSAVHDWLSVKSVMIHFKLASTLRSNIIWHFIATLRERSGI